MGKTYNASSYDELFVAMMRVNAIALERLSEKVFDMWITQLKEGWYDMYDPIVYNRTEAILKALVNTKIEQVGNTLIARVYIDEMIMNENHPNSQGYLDGVSVMNIVEEDGMFLLNGVERKPAHAHRDTLEWVRNNYASYLAKELKMQTNMKVQVR